MGNNMSKPVCPGRNQHMDFPTSTDNELMQFHARQTLRLLRKKLRALKSLKI